MKRILLLVMLGGLALACGDTQPTDPFQPGDPAHDIQDAVLGEGGNKAFYWLPPMVDDPSPTGVFNAGLKPRVSVCVVDLDLNACREDDPADPADDPIIEWTVDSGLTVSSSDEHYGFEWHTDETVPDYDLTYRIQVFLTEEDDAPRLGYADVQFFNNGQEMKNIDTGESIALRDGRTLPGRFRIEKGASCNAETDCGEAIVGPDGGVVTTEAGFAGVAVPAGALDGDILITIRRVDPESQPWGDCLPTGLRQEEGCYDYDTEPAIGEVNSVDGEPFDFFKELVTVGVCIDPAAARPENLVLHKYDPENRQNGVVELDGADETFLSCDGFGVAYAAPDGLFGQFASAVRRAFAPVGRLLGGRPLYATDTGRGGLTDAFSFVGWAEPATLSLESVAPEFAGRGTSHSQTIHVETRHNHPPESTADASGVTLRVVSTAPSGATVVTSVDTDENGRAIAEWVVQDEPGQHTLTVSTRSEIDDGGAFVVPDETPLLTLMVGAFATAGACDDEGETDCIQAVAGSDGETIVTPSGFAGVDIPEGALDGDILITIRHVDPTSQPWGDCLPTGLRQEEGCYEYDTDPAIGEVNSVDGEPFDFFKELVTVGICLDQDAVRPEKLTLHKYDPEKPAGGVVELAGADEDFLTCPGDDDAISFDPDAGGFERLAWGARRILRPVSHTLFGRPLYATDTGRGGLTDAFSFIGWAEPVTLALTSQQDAGTGLTDVVVTATTAHQHGTAEPSDGTDIRFAVTAPGGAETVTTVPTTLVGGAAEARLTLSDLPGIHTVRVSTEDSVEIDSESFLVPDPTTVLVEDVEVLQSTETGALFGEVITPGAAGSPITGVAGVDIHLQHCGEGSEIGQPGQCTTPTSSTTLVTDENGRFSAELETGLWEIRPAPGTADYPGITPVAWTVEVPMVDEKGVGAQFTALIVDQQQTGMAEDGGAGIFTSGDASQAVAQTFTAGLNAHIREIQAPITCSSDSELNISIQTLSDGIPSGTIVGSATVIPAGTLPDLGNRVDFQSLPLSEPVEISADVGYAVVLSAADGHSCDIRAGAAGDLYGGGDSMFLSPPNQSWVRFGEFNDWSDLPFRILVQ